MSTEFKTIGVIRTPFTEQAGMPIQPAGARGVAGRVEVDPEFAAGLKDLDGFSHVILLYRFHAGEGFRLLVAPFLDDLPHGVFATRAPRRPNPIGLSVVRLVGVRDNVLLVENVDMLDGTPLLDIKPYVPEFDAAEDVRTGWVGEVPGKVGETPSDGRFG